MKQMFLLLTAIIVLSSCDHESGSGNIINEKRSVDEFSGITVGGSFEVEVKVGATQQVEVEADDNIIKYVKTTVSGNTLRIRLEGGHSYNNVHLKVYVTTPGLKKIDASASAEVKVLDVLKNDGKISFDANSSADIEAEVDAPAVDAEASSSGTIKLSGKTKDYTARASSSGDIKSFELLTENADVDANSSGSIDLHASVTLKANASSSGSIEYRGAASVNKSVSSSGSVEKKD